MKQSIARVLRRALPLLLLALVLPALALGEGDEVISNGGFEEIGASGLPTGWYINSYRAQEGYSRYRVTDEKAHSGQYSAMIENINNNDTRYILTVDVEPASLYRFSGYVWVESMEGGNGANLALEDMYAYSECLLVPTDGWYYVEWYGETGDNQTEVTLGVRVGGYSSESRGKAYFDDISLVRVDELPEYAVATLWYEDGSAAPAASASEKSDERHIGVILLAACAYLAIAALLARALRRDDRMADQLTPAARKGCGLAVGAVLLAALCVRVVLAMNVSGYDVDIGCFTAWGNRMLAGGPSAFYAEGYFCDYPPAYLYVLWLTSAITGALSPLQDGYRLLLLKLAPILCDIGAAALVYAFARKRVPSMLAVTLAGLFALNPAGIVTGSCWGQVDGVLALMLIACAVWSMERKWQYALPMYVLAVLTKPQALLCGLPALAWLLCCLIYHREDRKAQLLHALYGLLAGVAAAVAVVLPFSIRQPNLQWLLTLYGDTLGSYQYAVLNTANLMYLLGGNWSALTAAEGDAVRTLSWAIPAASSAALMGWAAAAVLRPLRRDGWRALWRNLLIRLRGNDGDASLARRLLIALVCAAVALAFLVLCFFPATYLSYGTIWMVFVNAIVLLPMLAERDARKLPFMLALVLAGTYVLGIKIHERYLYAGIALLFLGAGACRDKRMLWLAVGFSVTTFINTAVVLDNCIVFGSSMGHLNSDTMPLNITLCVLNLLLMGGAYASYTVDAKVPKAVPEQEPAQGAINHYRSDLLTPRDARLRMSWKETLVVLLVTGAYAFLAFFNLGSFKAPQSGWVSTSPEETVTFELDDNEGFTLLYYGGVSYQNFTVAVSEDGETWSEEHPCQMKEGLCYRWLYAVGSTTAAGDVSFQSLSPENVLRFEGKYLRLTARSAGLLLYEVIARDADGVVIPMRVVGHEGVLNAELSAEKPPEHLLDEQDTLEGEPGWYTGTYFDEIYHARTAYEHLHGQIPYETTHPPLGKLLMAVGISIFGMTPFGWRFMGALVGVLMVPTMYLLCKQLTRRRDLSTFAMVMLTLDTMHFTQTRLGTIDSFPVLFIMLSYLFMTRYALGDFYAVSDGELQSGRPRLFNRPYVNGLIALFLSGLSMGLGIASKWIGIYSVAGLALIFAWAAYRQLRAAGEADALRLGDPSSLSKAQSARVDAAAQYGRKRLLMTCGFCVVFFILVPAVIYYLSYIPYLSPSGPVTLSRVIKAQEGMLSYHSTPGLGMDHPFYSPWYEWPLILKPMWYAQDQFEPAGYESTILCFGNPVVFYLGALAMVALMLLCVWRFVRRTPWPDEERLQTERRGAGIIAVGFLAQYLPWVLVPRGMYIYHYFASVPFIILAASYWMGLLPKRKPARVTMLVLCVLALAAFIALYPYASGCLTGEDWLRLVQKYFISKLYY